MRLVAVKDKLCDKQLRGFEHAMKRERSKITRQAMELLDERTRTRGRSKLRWCQTADLKEILGDAQIRVKWTNKIAMSDPSPTPLCV